ncbi:MAG: hypothetical protein IIA90_06955 [Chloroflexi bacterium]|nr:hypothetical protein [Chloroflexota bacterium]
MGTDGAKDEDGDASRGDQGGQEDDYDEGEGEGEEGEGEDSDDGEPLPSAAHYDETGNGGAGGEDCGR